MKEPKYEFLKGVAISFVILLHTIESTALHTIGHIYHLGQAVPLFILTTFVLSYKSLNKHGVCKFRYWYNSKKFRSMIYRIFVPFFVTQFAIWATTCVLKGVDVAVFDIRGIGPGSYYPWIYLQFWLMMPFLYYLCTQFSLVVGGMFFLLASELFQIGCCLVDFPDYYYRLLFFRYFFLAYLGYLYLKLKMNMWWYLLFTSIGVAYYLSLNVINYEPLLFNSWMGHQLPAFFYTFVFFYIILHLYHKFANNFIVKYFVRIGEYSWMIFLMQMFYVQISKDLRLSSFPDSFSSCVYIMGVYFFSVYPILLYDRYCKKKCVS